MKYFLDYSATRTRFVLGAIFVAAIVTIAAVAELPPWIRNIEAGTALETVFFRMMPLPNAAVAFRRPPKETLPALTELIRNKPHDAELYSLRALEDEQQLDFNAAESDWKECLENSSNKIEAQLALADFYHRRLRPADEINTLSLVATDPPSPSEKLTPPTEQRSWSAFERIFSVIQAQGLSRGVSITHYRAWLGRYPHEASVYSRFLEFLVREKEYPLANHVIDDYRKQFPTDQIFPVKAKAMVEYRRGSVREGLSVYEQTFQPLWDPHLVKSYFELLRDTENLRKFRDDARAALAADPEDLNATARLFYYYQQQGKTEEAQQVIANLRRQKESRNSTWTSQQLYICARLLEEIHAYPESARYYFALYNSRELPDAQQTAVSGLTSILLTAPETPIRFGSGELSMYRDIATLDQGPGYLNGMLSLILNTTEPAAHYSEEEQRALPYFHRARAAELLNLLDSKFPNAPLRPELHAQMLDFYANSGETDVVIEQGREFLANFHNSPQRTAVALRMADAYARKGQASDEFAIYDAVLQELAAQAQNVPLGTATAGYASGLNSYSPQLYPNQDGIDQDSNEGSPRAEPEQQARSNQVNQRFQVGVLNSPTTLGGARSPEYARVLERYLARLVQLKQIPSALALLRREIDRNPDDPGLYERLATFLEQNRLGEQQEEVYKLALSRFSEKSWYDKLARFYLRSKRDAEFEKLTRDAVASFKGSELEQYFNHVVGGSPHLYLRLNLYANHRFPHNPVFVRNLLSAYMSPKTYDAAAWEALLRQHWFEDPALRNRFFEFLSSRGKLRAELEALRQSAPDAAAWQNNPAAANFLGHAELWRSHFEESAPVLLSLATQYPAEPEIASTASSVYRSLAYFAPADTAVAARIEDRFLDANPTSTETMARIGDIYADRELLTQAALYWERIPQVAPGQPDGYLEAATIYWDYFDFENALRLLNKGRNQLANPFLYSYEAGAIYENQRDYRHAVDEYVKGAIASPDSSAESRLLQLARRPKFRDLTDQATSRIASSANPSIPAIDLRVKVLEAQNRRPEMESFLDSLVNSTTSMDQAAQIESLAQRKSLETVRQHALEKQAALTTDPITRLQLRYELVRLYEGRRDFVSAQKNVEALYRENPKILGVVRSTVDFYWRTKMQPQAIAVLLQAAKDAYPVLGSQFTYEAARKATESRDFQQARDLLARLMKESPYDPEYLAAMAHSYSQAGDDRGLETFYRNQIAAFRTAQLSAEIRKNQIAALRRGLIPALTRMKNYPGAVDQYIELINSFPEDDALVTEAAFYALRYQRQDQLIDFYARTVAQSPRDYRWSMVLAHIHTNLENYPEAIDKYSKSIAIRPDRPDLYIARSDLELRLMRFDEAAADYDKLYQLAYKDPQWMEKLASVRARQGQTKAAVAALETALITGRPDNAANYFEVSRRLETWDMLNQARDFAEKAISKAGPDLLADAVYREGAKSYVHLLTRMRQHEQAYATLRKALDASQAELPIVKLQVERQGISGLTNAQWREHMRRTRVETARAGMQICLREMGAAVGNYFTPEERLNFAHFAESIHNGMPPTDVENFAIPLAASAALADQEAHWRFDLLLLQPGLPNGYGNAQPLIDLQRRRGRFTELASQMEQFAAAIPPRERGFPLLTAADAYHSAGDEQNELRVLSSAFSVTGSDPNRLERFFHLLLEIDADRLVQIASIWNTRGQQAADYVLLHGSVSLSHAVVQARGKERQPVWNKSYNALVGLYLAETSPEVNTAFLGALGNDTVGVRVAKPVDRAQQLAGNTWFYYGSRYGEYLGTAKFGNPEDYLPAILEESPASASGYLSLADYYSGSGDNVRAIADYNHTLELSPGRPDVYDNLAIAYLKEGDRAAAGAQWKQAFATLSKQLDSGRVPESFWRDFGRTCDQLRTRHLFPELKPDADVIVRTYLQHNGTWRSNAVLHPAYIAQGDPASATAWLIDISASAADSARVLADVVEASWIPVPQRATIYRRILELKEAALNNVEGILLDNAKQDLALWQEGWIAYLVHTKQYSQADAAISALPSETREQRKPSLVPLELHVAGQLGTLDAKLASYRANPEAAPAPEILRIAAHQSLQAGDKQSAREILELVFAREIEQHQLIAANFLGLAEIRLLAGDTAGALDLLRRLVVAVGAPFENLDPAAALLEKTGHNAEAIEFLDQLAKSAPWDSSYRLRLAKAELIAGKDAPAAELSLSSIASGFETQYQLRVSAATALSGRSHPKLGSAELDLLAASPAELTPAAADKFYFYEARIQAAAKARDPQTKVQLLSHCVIDFPRRDLARVPLFQAAIEIPADNYALGIIEPLLQTQLVPSYKATQSADQAQIANSDAEEEENGDDAPHLRGTGVTELSRAQQAHLAQQIGDTMHRVGRDTDALSYYQAASTLESSRPARKALLHKIAETKEVLRIQQENSAHHPVLHQALEQDRVVRPRILARSAPALNRPTNGGVQP